MEVPPRPSPPGSFLPSPALPPHLADHLLAWRAQQVRDELQLVHHVTAREQRLAQQHLRKDAADAPDVNGRAAGKGGWNAVSKAGVGPRSKRDYINQAATDTNNVCSCVCGR